MSDVSSPTAVPEKKSFDFVDTIRCISMIGIVFEHCSVLWSERYTDATETIVQVSVMQFFKFATIAFFLIGGFLINYKFTEYTPIQYIKNRFKNTIGPWAFWIGVLMVLNLLDLFIKYQRYHGDYDLPDFRTYFGEELYHILFYTSFWFILNFLICISLLLIFKKYLYKLSFGIIWGLISLFYSLNLYYGWIITEHSTALFGFVVYLWMGVYMNRHFDVVSWFIQRISYFWLIFINVVLFVLADAETIHLMSLGSNDPFNTLRITNILYSLGMFALLLKIANIKFIQVYLKPRQTTFGIYLIHTILILHLLRELNHLYPLDTVSGDVYLMTWYSVLRFLIVYGISFILVRLIMLTRMRWAIGVSKAQPSQKRVPGTPL